MHGLINRAIQRFVTDSYGEALWVSSVGHAGLETTEFEAMWTYDAAVTPRLLSAVCDILDRPYEELLEDIGTYLVSHPNASAVRRLLRFGGVSFVEFLHSLEDLPDRARLAVSDLDMPKIEVFEASPNDYALRIYSDTMGWGHVFAGVLRALADDYGALAYLEHKGREGDCETVNISLLETEFAVGREFELGVKSG